MLSQSEIELIRTEADEFMHREIEGNYQFYQDTMRGKEAGHQLGDRIDQKFTEHLQEKFADRIGFEKSNGKKCNRSMGDFWFKNSMGCFTPINVKFGVVRDGEITGQPNIASINKVMDGIISGMIDSYYLLIVKVFVNTNDWSLSYKVWFTDILDWLDKSVISFDAGPGQMMLKAKKFHDLFGESSTTTPRLDVKTKLRLLKELLDDGERRLWLNRERRRKSMEAKYNSFMGGKSTVSRVDPCTKLEIS